MSVNRERIERDIEIINSHNSTPGRGTTRLTFTPEYMAAFDYVKAELERIGASLKINRAGNMTARVGGTDPDSPSVMFGSHLDTVVNGGRFDGVAGVVTALEAARVVVEQGFRHRHPLEVVVFTEEEGSRFGTVLAGSRAWAGKIDQGSFENLRDKDGVGFLQAMSQAGLEPDEDSLLDPGAVKAMLELHIEQSVVLESRGISIGIVEAIAGIKSFLITLEGEANHAGGTPMAYRRDTLQGAARIISEIEDIACSKAGPNTVATVGYISCRPGQFNVIPGFVEMSLDVRDTNADFLDSAVDKCMAAVRTISEDRGLSCRIEQRSDTPPIELSSEIKDIFERKAGMLGRDSLRMISGALHDSSVVAELTEGGMIFVPSRKGRSHCPEEDTSLDDIVLGCEVLLETVKELSI